MKAITLTEPWASLFALGCKTIETRDWATRERGWFAIHSAKGFPGYAQDFAVTHAVQSCMLDARSRLARESRALSWLDTWMSTGRFAHSHVIGVAYLAHCEETHKVFDVTGQTSDLSRVTVMDALSWPTPARRQVPKHEQKFGDYRARGDKGKSRYAFWATHFVPLAEPVPRNGKLGFWDLGDDFARELVRQGVVLPTPDSTTHIVTRGGW